MRRSLEPLKLHSRVGPASEVTPLPHPIFCALAPGWVVSYVDRPKWIGLFLSFPQPSSRTMPASSSQSPAPRRQTQRRWRVPPALTRGEEPFEGAEILDEVPGPLGLVLWQALRDVVLWAGAPPAERAGLFAEGAERNRLAGVLAAGAEDELERPLAVLAGLAERPERSHGDRISLACRKVSQWADERGMLRTALAFAQGAALAAPGDAQAAYVVGRFARRRAEYARAESWFRLAITLARQSGDWTSYALSFIGLGNLYRQRANMPMARRFHIRALRAAKRNSLREIHGMALHDLFTIAIETGNIEAAGKYAHRAVEEYSRAYGGSPRLPALAHDVAFFWMTQGHFQRALPVLQALLPHFHTPMQRLLALGNLTRAAGGANDKAAFETAWAEAWALSQDPQAVESAARALLNMAHGAASIGAWDRARSAAERALTLGNERAEARIQFGAEALLDSVRHERRAEVAPAPVPQESTLEEADSLASELVSCLTETAGTDPQ